MSPDRRRTTNTVLDPHNGPRRPTKNIITAPRAPKQANPLAYSGKTTDIAVQTSPTEQPHLHHYHGRSSHHVANISNKRPAIRHIVRNTSSGPSQDLPSTSSKFPYCPWIRCHQHPATGLDAEERPRYPTSPQNVCGIVGSVYVGLLGHHQLQSQRGFCYIRQARQSCRLTNNHPFSSLETGTTDPQRLQRIVHSWGPGLTVMQFSGSQITRLSTVHGRRHSVNRPLPLDPIAGSYLAPPKRAILASNTARQAFIAAATNRNPDPVQCNTLRDEWSQTQGCCHPTRESGLVAKQWVKHADNLDLAVSDGRTDLVFRCCTCHVWKQCPVLQSLPLYNSDGIVQYDPTSIMRCQCKVTMVHLASRTPQGHSLDFNTGMIVSPFKSLQYTPIIRKVTFSTRTSRGIKIAAAFLQ
ncbi:hypothetical protein BASA83_013750 [Batrachochytrium salamandrivorans]|nr:hypothetical protein BASA83_013750 [Batrachochytrium salamandrivorans]